MVVGLLLGRSCGLYGTTDVATVAFQPMLRMDGEPGLVLCGMHEGAGYTAEDFFGGDSP